MYPSHLLGPGFQFKAAAHNFLLAMGRLRFCHASQNNGTVHFYLSSSDPERNIVRPGLITRYGDAFLNFIRVVAQGQPILGKTNVAAIEF